MFLSCKLGESSLSSNLIVHGKTEKTDYEVLSEADIASQFINVRLQTYIPFICNFQHDMIKEASTNLRKQVSDYKMQFFITILYNFWYSVSIRSGSVSFS